MPADDPYQTDDPAKAAADHKRMTDEGWHDAGIIREMHRLHPDVGALFTRWTDLAAVDQEAHLEAAEAFRADHPFDVMDTGAMSLDYTPSDEARAARAAYEDALRRIGAVS